MPATSDIILTTINARYVHAALGLRYLAANMGALQPRTRIIEFVLGQRAFEIATVSGLAFCPSCRESCGHDPSSTAGIWRRALSCHLAWRPEREVPCRQLYMIRFHGVLVPNAKLRSHIVPTPAP